METDRITGLLKTGGKVITFVGILVGLGNLLGWFCSKDRADFYNLVKNSATGIPIGHPAAEDFMNKFPPPSNFGKAKITHIIKLKLQTMSKFTISGALRYMDENQKESSDVASFEDVRRWSEETPYGWVAWWLILIGFVIGVAEDLLRWLVKGRKIK